MKKVLFRTLFVAFFAIILILPQKVKADPRDIKIGTNLKTLSESNPSIYSVFTIKSDEECYFYFKVKGTSNVWFHLENMSGGDSTIEADFLNGNGDYICPIDDVISNLKLTEGYIGSSVTVSDLKNGGIYSITVKNAHYTGMEEMKVGICVFSEELGGTQYDFVGQGSCETKSSSKISLSKDSISLKKGKTAKLKVTLAKSLKSEGVTWKSSDKKVATVSKTGKITAKGYGIATITCTSKKNKKYYAQCIVTVAKKTTTTNDNSSENGNSGNDNNSTGNGSTNSGSVNCSSCGGSGKTLCTSCGGQGMKMCLLCGGTGGTYQSQLRYDPVTGMMTSQMVRVNCSSCGGSGRSLCGSCMGTGRTNCYICGGTGKVHR